MSRSFSISFNEEPLELIERAKSRFADNDSIDFNGDENNGTFSAFGVSGKYDIEENTITITISKKPFIYPWRVIKKKIKNFFV